LVTGKVVIVAVAIPGVLVGSVTDVAVIVTVFPVGTAPGD
jgi:hypothetical protein